MKTLIVEDAFTCRVLLQEFLKPYGSVHIAVNGEEAVDAFEAALNSEESYDLVCLDIMMPGMDGQQALKSIRNLEQQAGIALGDGCRIIMTTSLDDNENVIKAFRETCDAYLVKPVDREKMIEHLKSLCLVSC